MSKAKDQTKKPLGLESAGILFLFGGGIASIANYLFHFSLGRLLGVADYGVLGAMLSIFNILNVGTASAAIIVSEFTAKFNRDSKHVELITELVYKLLLRFVQIGGLAFLIFVLLSPLMKSFLKLESTYWLILVGAIGFLSFISAVPSGVLNGLQKFIWQNVIGVIPTYFKVGVAILLVYLGFGVPGALVGFLVSITLAILISFYALKQYIKPGVREGIELGKIKKKSIRIFLTNLFPWLLISLDVLLVKSYMSSKDAGMYTAASNVAKIVLFISTVFEPVVFPKLVDAMKARQRTNILIIRSILYTATMAAFVLLIFLFLPEVVLRNLYGSNYLAATPLIFKFGLGMAFFSVCMIFTRVNIAKNRYHFLWIYLFGILSEVIGISLFHQSLENVVEVFLAVNGMIFLGFLIYNFKDLILNHRVFVQS